MSFPAPTLEQSGRPEPVVFILGGTGSTEETLAPYRDLYEVAARHIDEHLPRLTSTQFCQLSMLLLRPQSAGCITVRYTAPAACLYSRSLTRPPAARLAALLAELAVADSPLIGPAAKHTAVTTGPSVVITGVGFARWLQFTAAGWAGRACTSTCARSSTLLDTPPGWWVCCVTAPRPVPPSNRPWPGRGLQLPPLPTS